MNPIFFAGSRLLSTRLVRTVNAAGTDSLAQTSTSNTLSTLMSKGQLSRISRQYSTGNDEQEKNKTSNILQDDALKGFKIGGFLGLAQAIDSYVKGASLKDSVDYGLRSALREGMKGAAAGSLIGAVRSDNPEDMERVKSAAAKGLGYGICAGATIVGLTVPLTCFTIIDDPQLLLALSLFGAVLGGCTGAYAGPVLATAYAGLSAKPAPLLVKQAAHVEKFNTLTNDINSIKTYWFNFMSHHQLGEEHFNEYMLSMDVEDFRARFENLQELQKEHASLQANDKLTVSMYNKVRDNLRVIENLVEIGNPVMERINESNKYTFR